MMLKIAMMVPGRQHRTLPMRDATRIMIHFFCWPLISQCPVPSRSQVKRAATTGFASGLEILAIGELQKRLACETGLTFSPADLQQCGEVLPNQARASRENGSEERFLRTYAKLRGHGFCL